MDDFKAKLEAYKLQQIENLKNMKRFALSKIEKFEAEDGYEVELGYDDDDEEEEDASITTK